MDRMVANAQYDEERNACEKYLAELKQAILYFYFYNDPHSGTFDTNIAMHTRQKELKAAYTTIDRILFSELPGHLYCLKSAIDTMKDLGMAGDQERNLAYKKMKDAHCFYHEYYFDAIHTIASGQARTNPLPPWVIFNPDKGYNCNVQPELARTPKCWIPD